MTAVMVLMVVMGLMGLMAGMVLMVMMVWMELMVSTVSKERRVYRDNKEVTALLVITVLMAGTVAMVLMGLTV